SRPSWKAADLSRELKVSERTVHRYMGMLEEMGIPLMTERGPYGGFSLMRGYKLPPLIFTAEEATVLYMGANLVREVWGQTYDDAVTSVTAKLDNVLPDDLRQEVARSRESLVIGGLARFDYRPWEATIHILRRCIINNHSVHLVYKGIARRQETKRKIDPYALTFQWGLWYMIGFCHLRQEMRTFRVDRIQQVTPLPDDFVKPANFSVREYLSSMQYEPAFTVVIRLDAGVASHFREWYGSWMQIQEHEDASITVRFGADGLDWVTGWVLRQGPAALVLEPHALVERVRLAAKQISERYEKTSPVA
ncbi:MAG: YafY family transcriptional regulator, partial [Anaerolineales bacterium]|nr:YafY family transcriptional regulator [Anaerolineales bacterium]